jgi:hypothetical protein
MAGRQLDEVSGRAGHRHITNVGAQGPLEREARPAT